MEFMVGLFNNFLIIVVLAILVVGIIISIRKSFWAGTISFGLFILNFIANSVFAFLIPRLLDVDAISFTSYIFLNRAFGIFFQIVEVAAFGILVFGLYSFFKKINTQAS